MYFSNKEANNFKIKYIDNKRRHETIQEREPNILNLLHECQCLTALKLALIPEIA